MAEHTVWLGIGFLGQALFSARFVVQWLASERVTHAPRAFGRSKYGNLQRAAVGIVDLLGTAWLIRRRRLPHAQELARPVTPDLRDVA